MRILPQKLGKCVQIVVQVQTYVQSFQLCRKVLIPSLKESLSVLCFTYYLSSLNSILKCLFILRRNQTYSSKRIEGELLRRIESIKDSPAKKGRPLSDWDPTQKLGQSKWNCPSQKPQDSTVNIGQICSNQVTNPSTISQWVRWLMGSMFYSDEELISAIGCTPCKS
jgi:hypothetical protein